MRMLEFLKRTANDLKKRKNDKLIGRFYKEGAGQTKSLPKNSECNFLVVAFNSATVIKFQFQKLNKYSEDQFRYYIVDNSTDSQASCMIKDFANGIDKCSYIRVPNNPVPFLGGSYSHGLALNW